MSTDSDAQAEQPAVPTKSPKQKIDLLLRGRREGLTQEEIAKLAGKARSAVARWESEYREKVDKLFQAELDMLGKAEKPLGSIERAADEMTAMREGLAELNAKVDGIAATVASILVAIEKIAAAVASDRNVRAGGDGGR